MTDITHHSLQNQIIQEEPSINEQDRDSILEEGDITEAFANTDKVYEKLGWKASKTLEESLLSVLFSFSSYWKKCSKYVD